MSLKQAQERLEQANNCRAFTVFNGFDKEDAAVLSEWIAERRAVGFIARIISADGVLINEKTVSRHIHGVCCCPDGTTYKGAYRVTSQN
jgi:hypothetical protein